MDPISSEELSNAISQLDITKVEGLDNITNYVEEYWSGRPCLSPGHVQQRFGIGSYPIHLEGGRHRKPM